MSRSSGVRPEPGREPLGGEHVALMGLGDELRAAGRPRRRDEDRRVARGDRDSEAGALPTRRRAASRPRRAAAPRSRRACASRSASSTAGSWITSFGDAWSRNPTSSSDRAPRVHGQRDRAEAEDAEPREHVGGRVVGDEHHDVALGHAVRGEPRRDRVDRQLRARRTSRTRRRRRATRAARAHVQHRRRARGSCASLQCSSRRGRLRERCAPKSARTSWPVTPAPELGRERDDSRARSSGSFNRPSGIDATSCSR